MLEQTGIILLPVLNKRKKTVLMAISVMGILQEFQLESGLLKTTMKRNCFFRRF